MRTAAEPKLKPKHDLDKLPDNFGHDLCDLIAERIAHGGDQAEVLVLSLVWHLLFLQHPTEQERLKCIVKIIFEMMEAVDGLPEEFSAAAERFMARH